MTGRWLATCLCLAVWAAGSGLRPAAAQPDEAERPAAIRFRRVYVPAARREDWPLGQQKYLPVAPDEFERLVAASAGPVAPTDSPALTPRLVRAEYEAQLEGDRLTGGRGTLWVEHTSESRALLRLDPCGLAVGSAVWSGEEPQSAAFGMGVDGSLDVLVEQSGPLEMEWSLAGRRDAAGSLVFPVRLPASPISRLLLTTPDGTQPAVDRGAVLDAGRDEEGNRLWRIELGNRHEFELRVTTADGELPRSGLALVREKTGYDVSLRGVEVSTEWSLEIHHEAVSQIAFQLDDQLQLVTATLGDEPIPWTVLPAETGKPSRVVLRLPRPVQGTGLLLRLGALAPRVGDRTWRLPRIQPEDIFWQEGSATLSVRSPLVVERLTPVGCRQTGTEVLPAPQQGESFQLQFFHLEATAELDIVEQQDRVEVVSGTSIQWGDEGVRARVRADFRVANGARFELQGALGPQWMVDTVESTPADVVDQWAVEPDGRGGRRLTVRLARPLAPGRPIRLSIATRRLGTSLGEAIGVRALAPLEFDAGPSSRAWVGLRMPETYELEYVGASAGEALSRESLPPSEAELLDADEAMAVFRLDGAARDPLVRLEPRRPRFQAEIHVEARVAEKSVQESYRIRCEPESARLDRVVVWLSRQRDEPLEWTAEGEPNMRISARKWSSDEQLAAGVSAEGEVWELRPSPPASDVVVFTARRDWARTGSMHPSLASVPDAETQTGLLAVRAAPGTALDIEHQRLRQVPPEPLPAERYASVRAAYRYDPWREVGRVGEPAVTVSARTAGPATLATVWEARLDSRLATDGTACHTAVFHVENLGQDALRIHLPAAMRGDGPIEVWVDGRRVTATGSREGALSGARPPETGSSSDVPDPYHELRVALPVERKYPTVALVFTTKQRPLLPLGVVQAPWPEPDVAVLNRSWTVWLPPGYAAYGGSDVFLPVAPPARSWSQRLLGPLGRPAAQTVFDPLAPDHWLALPGDAAERREAVERVEAWLDQAAASPPDDARDAEPALPLRLRTLVTHESLAELKRKLLVDREALARHGILPDDPLAGDSEGSARLAPQRLLAGAGVAVLVSRDAALLTSQANAARLRPHLEPTSNIHIWWIASRPLSERIAYASRAEADRVYPLAAQWVTQPSRADIVWTGDRLPGQEAVDQLGWQAVSPPPGGDATGVRYYHGYSVQLAGLVTFLCTVSVGWWLARQRPRALLGVAGMAGLGGLWLPAPFVPITAGMVLGAFFCLAFRFVHRRRALRQQHPHGRRAAVPALPSTVSVTIPWGLVLLVAAFATGRSAAARADAAGSEPGAILYRVFIPVDEQKKPVGGKYYLPEPLLAELHRRTAARRDLPQGWLLGAAVYRGELTREPVGERLHVDQIRAQFHLHVFTPSARVQIPLDRSSANLLPDGVSLDGAAVEVEWSADNRALVFEVAEPGQYRVELRMRPRMEDAPSSGFDLSIPPLPMAQLELALPSAAPPVEVPSARGNVSREEDPARLIAELGPSELLSVRWPSGSGAPTNGPAVDIEELLWMKVQPGSVLLEVKWNLTVLEGRVRRLRLAADPRLRPLPLEGDRSPTIRTLSGDGELLQLVFEWPEPLQEETVVSARFLLTGTSGIGNLRMPQLDVLDGRMTRRWLAVSVAEALQFERNGFERLAPVPATEFAAAWGEAKDAPSFAYRLSPGTPDWTLATRPREPSTTAEKDLTLRFAEHAIDVELSAKLETTSGYGFRYRIAAPKTLEVVRVALLVDGVDRIVRWSQDETGDIHLFLAGPVSGTQQLTLHGRLPIALGEVEPVPLLRMEGVEDTGTTLQVLRRPGILVELRGVDRPVSTEVPPSDKGARSWLPVGTYRLTPDTEQAAAILVTANEPKLAGSEILRVSTVEGVWHARWECRLDVHDGLLEELTVDAPANWGNRFRTSDGVEWSRRTTDAGRQELTIRPQRPVEARWWAWISGRLPVAPGEPVAVPDIAMRTPGKVARFVILPRHVDGRPMDWQVQGLQQVPLVQVAPELAPEQGVLAAFRVVGKAFSAELPELPASWNEGRVHLAEYAMTWQEGGGVAGIARFDLEPGTEPSCTIRFPEAARPVLMTVDGVHTAWNETSESGVVTVPLGALGVPQRVEAVFAVDTPRPDRRALEPAVPHVVDVAVDQTLWTFAAPYRRIAGTPPTDSEGASQLARTRLECISAMIERYTLAAGDDSTDTNRWYRMWLGRWVAAREAARAEAERLPDESARRRAFDRIDALTEQQADTAARLDAADTLNQWLEAGPAAEELAPTQFAPLFRDRSLAYYEGVGRLPQMGVRIAPLPAVPVTDRMLATAGWILLLGLVAFGLRRGLLLDTFRRWPHAVGVVVGLAWWLWLSPSALGLLVVVVCAVGSLWAGWRPISGADADTSVGSVRTAHGNGR